MEPEKTILDIYISEMIEGWLCEDWDYYEFEQAETDAPPGFFCINSR